MDMNEEYGLTPYETREILFYKTDNGEVRVEILLYQENLWLTQAKMAELFEVQKAAISKHLKNIFTSGELQEEAVVSKMETTAADGKRYNTSYYNLDAIIAVGYRVNSKKATMFRIWANRVLKEFIIKGYVMDDARLREPENLFGKDYFEEQLERIRDIRSSERRFYQKITDIYSQCSADYDVNSPVTKEFFATVQNKLHYAVTHHTAAEIVYGRADSTKPNMGLTTWKNAPQGRIRKSDVSIAKNYLNEEEMINLNEIVTMYLDYAERQARRGNIMYMQDWVNRLDAFLQFNEEDILHDKGKVTAAIAKAFAESEFEKFLMEFKDNATYNKDFNAILLALSKIIDKGALERFFRIEGRMNDHVSALSIDSRKLRLYCLRISDQILILGNGGVKLSRTYQENEKLSGYVMDLQTFDKVLLKAQEKGIITIEKNMITDIESATFEI